MLRSGAAGAGGAVLAALACLPLVPLVLVVPCRRPRLPCAYNSSSTVLQMLRCEMWCTVARCSKISHPCVVLSYFMPCPQLPAHLQICNLICFC